jgi:hypothetical protein
VRRFFSQRQRRLLAWVSGGVCTECGGHLSVHFHADHIVPFSQGGATVTRNGRAVCPACNLRKGSRLMQTILRPWQAEALDKALHWFMERRDRHFLINAAPGAGKTLAACAIAKALIDRSEIDRIIVIAPRAEVVNQWGEDFRRVTGRFMTKVTGRDQDIGSFGMDLCATWAAVQCAAQRASSSFAMSTITLRSKQRGAAEPTVHLRMRHSL